MSMDSRLVYTNQELGKRIKKGELEAFDLVYKKYSQRLYGFAFSMLKNKEDAKEIVQETFLKLWSHRTKINSSYSFKSFLFSISFNITIDLLRRRTQNTEFKNYLRTHFNGESSRTDELVQYRELTEVLEQLIDDLPAQRRKIYQMSREEGLSHKEIAEKLGITVKTVENHLNLALKYFRKKMDAGSLISLLFVFLFV